MKKLTCLALVLIAIGCQKKTERQLLTEVSQSLQKLEKIQYDFSFEKRDLESPKSGFAHTGTLALDLTKENSIGANVHSTRSKKGEKVFERLAINDTLIDILEKTKTIVKTPDAHPMILGGNLDLYFNVYDIRKSLPFILKDSTLNSLKVKDTVISSSPSISITFNIQKHIMGGALYDTKGIENTYQLVVRKKDYIPLLWKLQNETTIMTFSPSNVQFEIDDALWSYNNDNLYNVISIEEYRLREKNDLNKQLGNDFPEWQLSTIRGKKLSNKNFKNKVTLYEFFFVGCAGSISAKPFIKKLDETYGDKLNIVNVEIHDNPQKKVRSFVEKHGLREPAVSGGKSLADQLGVLGCPTYILVNRSGKIIYTSFGDKEGLAELIEKEI